MSFTKDLFEPALFQSGVDFERIVEMNDQLSLIQVIVEEINKLCKL